MYKATDKSATLVKVFCKAKTVSEVAQSVRSLEKVIEACDAKIEDVFVTCNGISLGVITSINGVNISVDDTALVGYKSFREALELARAVDPNQTAIVHVDGYDVSDEFFITNVTFEVFNLDENYPDGTIGCRLVLH